MRQQIKPHRHSLQHLELRQQVRVGLRERRQLAARQPQRGAPVPSSRRRVEPRALQRKMNVRVVAQEAWRLRLDTRQRLRAEALRFPLSTNLSGLC